MNNKIKTRVNDEKWKEYKIHRNKFVIYLICALIDLLAGIFIYQYGNLASEVFIFVLFIFSLFRCCVEFATIRNLKQQYIKQSISCENAIEPTKPIDNPNSEEEIQREVELEEQIVELSKQLYTKIESIQSSLTENESNVEWLTNDEFLKECFNILDAPENADEYDPKVWSFSYWYYYARKVPHMYIAALARVFKGVAYRFNSQKQENESSHDNVLFNDLYSIFSKFNQRIRSNRETQSELSKQFVGVLKGKDGERTVSKYLEDNNPGDWIIMDNAVLPNLLDGSKTSENDFIVISSNGVFSIEVKNYMKGSIFISNDGTVQTGHDDNDVNIIDQCNNHAVNIERILKSKIKDEDILRKLSVGKLVKGVIVVSNNEVEIKNDSTYPIYRLSLLRNFLLNDGEQKLLTEKQKTDIRDLLQDCLLPARKFEFDFGQLFDFNPSTEDALETNYAEVISKYTYQILELLQMSRLGNGKYKPFRYTKSMFLPSNYRYLEFLDENWFVEHMAMKAINELTEGVMYLPIDISVSEETSMG